MKGIIAEAHNSRMKGEGEEEKKDKIQIKDSWLEELTKHPYISSKTYFV
jgi:hypothetical protein